LIGLALAWASVPALAASLPTLVVEAPAELEPLAGIVGGFDLERLRPAMRLTGLEDPGPPITVVLAPEGSPAAGAAPRWVTGYASGARGIVVLLPARVPSYPDRSLELLLQHEVTHVLIYRAASGRPVPRWFNEGLAMAAGRGWDLEDRGRVALAVLRKGRVSLDRIDSAFAGGERAVQTAYALSEDLVQHLLRRHGRDVTAVILRYVAGGASFTDAFERATGETLAAAEASYWRRRTFWSRWVPLLTSSAVLWAGVSFLAVLAFQRRRARDARVHRQWEEEDRRREAAAAPAEREEPVN
jgi:hypothetical protein